jgi:TROVE domain
MSKYNRSAARAQARSVIATEGLASGYTYEGAPGYARTPESELFLLAVTHMGDGSFYESAPERDQRFRELVHKVAVTDPEWMAGFIPWLRLEANMRTASVVAAAENARALLEAGKPGGRPVSAKALQRADEAGELLAYWHSRYGRALPKPVKRGLAGAAARIYDEYALLKYDTASHGYRFADIIDLTHPTAREAWQGDLFKHALDRRHGHDAEIPGSLRMIRANAELRARAMTDPAVLLDSLALKSAGITWEDMLSLAGRSLPKRELWTAVIPSMGIMALTRNLRNFDDAGVPDEVAAQVAGKLTNPEVIARSRMFPFRFLAAYRTAPSLRWAYPLEQALSLSLANVPALPGRTLILVDRSGSMFDTVSAKSGLNRADTAALFGSALAVRSEHADLAEFGTTSQVVRFSRSESVLNVVGRFSNRGGTNTADAVRRHLRPKFHNRAVILTDEQAWAGYRGASPLDYIPREIPAYTWNLAGYRHGHGPSGGENRHAFGGLSDASFRMIPALESGRDAAWPWLAKSAA